MRANIPPENVTGIIRQGTSVRIVGFGEQECFLQIKEIINILTGKIGVSTSPLRPNINFRIEPEGVVGRRRLRAIRELPPVEKQVFELSNFPSPISDLLPQYASTVAVG